MGDVYFYHLTESSAEDCLHPLLAKTHAAGWRVLLRSASAEQAEALDQALWLGPEESFLPHGLAGGPQDADQPILLRADGVGPEGRDCLMTLGGAEIAAEEVRDLARACVIFDGADGQELSQARATWRSLTGAGLRAQYWAQSGGRWEKKAET